MNSHSPEQTIQFAKQLAEKYKNQNMVVALEGELGAGKTIFAKGFAEGLGIKDTIISPTFVLVREHPIPKTDKTFYHIDLYRLEDSKTIGLEELLHSGVVLIEWADKVKSKLPKGTIYIKIKKVSGNLRDIDQTII